MATVAQRGHLHDFSFAGGDILKKMGATWFVSYAYYTHVDNKHLDWNKVRTLKMRIKRHESSFSYHRYWLDKVLQMDDAKLNVNTIGLTSIEVKRMAHAILMKQW